MYAIVVTPTLIGTGERILSSPITFTTEAPILVTNAGDMLKRAPSETDQSYWNRTNKLLDEIINQKKYLIGDLRNMTGGSYNALRWNGWNMLPDHAVGYVSFKQPPIYDKALALIMDIVVAHQMYALLDTIPIIEMSYLVKYTNRGLTQFSMDIKPIFNVTR